MIENYKLNDIVQMKKDHPCKKSHYWKIIRTGADIKIKTVDGDVIYTVKPGTKTDTKVRRKDMNLNVNVRN